MQERVYVQVHYLSEDGLEDFTTTGWYSNDGTYELLLIDESDKYVNQRIEKGFSFIGKTFHLKGENSFSRRTVLQEGIGNHYWVTDLFK